MEEEELLQQYHGNLPFSFGSLQEVRRFIDINNKDLKNVLSKSNTYTEHKEFNDGASVRYVAVWQPLAQFSFGCGREQYSALRP